MSRISAKVILLGRVEVRPCGKRFHVEITFQAAGSPVARVWELEREPLFMSQSATVLLFWSRMSLVPSAVVVASADDVPTCWQAGGNSIRAGRHLTDEQWECIRKHFPEEHIADGRPGRKPVPTRRVLEAVLWILNTGAQWHMLPQSYPNYNTNPLRC
jgi:hypothetical protein